MELFFALAVALLSSPGQADEVMPRWVTFDVINPEQAGRHRVLHLEDLLGLAKTPVAEVPTGRSVIVFTVLAADCSATSGSCAVADALAAELGRLQETSSGKGALVIGLLVDPQEALPRVKKELPLARRGFILAADGHGVTRHMLGLDRPEELVVIQSTGKLRRFSSLADTAGPVAFRRKVEDAKRFVLQGLRRDKEDEP